MKLMMFERVPLLLLAILTTLHISHCAKSWMNAPYDEESDFNVNVEYNKNITLECSDDFFTPGVNFTPQYWILPNTTVMLPGDKEYFNTAKDGEAGWVVDDNVTMMVINVQERHFGFYYCVGSIPDTDDYHVVKKAVNFEGAYFGDLWDLYGDNTIIGCSAAGGFLVACIICYFTYYFFFEKSEDEVEMDEKVNAHHNEYTKQEVPDDDVDGVITKEGHYEVIQTEL